MQTKNDFWVEHTQMWLNNTFGNHEEWVRLSENGLTGTDTMQGLIRAFQIHNKISPSTGEVGPATRAKFKSLKEISKMDPDGEEDINVYIIQGALFCKGYNAGGLTGIFYNAGVAAIKELQSDSHIEETGNIGWKEWAALLSMNWFTLVDGGNPVVRTIQRQLNNEFSDQIGVGPCDGIVSRHTALSLIAALQAAEGINVTDDLNEINFGDETTARYPNPPLKIDLNTDYYKKFNRILQYGLYFNGCDPYRLDGLFDSKTQMSLSEFQEKHALLGSMPTIKQGICDVSTMKSLLTSKGDENRKASACDCATILNAPQARDLRNAGYTHVGRYLTGTVGVGEDERPKAITLSEIENIKNAGLSLVPIYQDGGSYPEYFENKSQGTIDARAAIRAALKLGIPYGTTIYFAVDYDCYGYEIEDNIIPYFKNIKDIFNEIDENIKLYKIGIYAPRYVCTKVSEKRLASTSFVCDMSTGFSGNLGFPIPENWAFDQFSEFKFSSNPPFDLDKDAYSGRDKGCSNFDKPLQLLDKALLQKLNEKSLAKEFGIFIESDLGQATNINLGPVKLKCNFAVHSQLNGEVTTLDFKHSPTPEQPYRTLVNGVTLESGPLGISVSPKQSATLYGYLFKFDGLSARVKFSVDKEGIKLQLELLQYIQSENGIIQFSELLTLQLGDFNIKEVIEALQVLISTTIQVGTYIVLGMLIMFIASIAIPAISGSTAVTATLVLLITNLLNVFLPDNEA